MPIVFDLDGTLVDSRADLARAVRHMLEAMGLPLQSDDEVNARVGRGAHYLIERSLPEDARSPERVEQGVALFRAYYGRHLADHTAPFPGIAEALGALSERTPLAVLTNKPGDLARNLLERLGLSPRLRVVLGAGDVPAHKPDPAGLREACRLLRAPPSATWYVGDMALDVETARAAGCPVAAVTWGLGTRVELEEAGPDRILESAAELATL